MYVCMYVDTCWKSFDVLRLKYFKRHVIKCVNRPKYTTSSDQWSRRVVLPPGEYNGLNAAAII